MEAMWFRVGAVFAALVVAGFAWSAFGHRFDQWLRAVRFFWRGKGSLVFVSAVVLVTWVLTQVPAFPVWDNFVQSLRVQQLDQGKYLTAAAALLALLLFAAQHAKSLAEEDATSPVYLYYNLNRFRASRTSLAHVISRLPFACAVGYLFVGPFLLPVLPRHDKLPAFSGIPGGPADWNLFGAAAWCACFVTVGAVLLLNAFGAIRYFGQKPRGNRWTEYQVETEYQDIARRTYRSLLRSYVWGRNSNSRDWFERQMINVKGLNETPQQQAYFKAVFPSQTYRKLRDRRLDRFIQMAKRGEPKRVEGGGRAEQVRSWLRLGGFKLRYAFVRSRLEAVVNVQRARQGRMTPYLADPALTGPVRMSVIDLLTNEALEVEEQLEELALAVSSCGQTGSELGDRFEEESRRLLFAPLEEVQASVPSNRNFVTLEPGGPTVPKFTAQAYLELVDALFARGQSASQRPEISLDELRLVCRRAGLIRNRFVREAVFEKLFTSLIERTITKRSEDESLPLDTIQLLTGRRPNQSETLYPRAFDEHRDARAIAEDIALVKAIGADWSAGESFLALLAVLADWQKPILLLVSLVAPQYSRSAVSPENAATLFKGLHSWRALLGRERDTAGRIAAGLVSLGHESLDVDEKTATWLLNALERPLDLPLCAQFLRERPEWMRGKFTLVEFLQWHLLAGKEGPTHYGAHMSLLDEQEALALGEAAEGVLLRAEEWEPLGLPSSSSLLYELEKLAKWHDEQ